MDTDKIGSVLGVDGTSSQLSDITRLAVLWTKNFLTKAHFHSPLHPKGLEYCWECQASEYPSV